MEGWHLYPSLKSLWLWVWLVATILWLYASFEFFSEAHASYFSSQTFYLVLTEVIWLGITKRIVSLKEQKLINQTNEKFAKSFTTISQCRYHVLSSVIGVPSSKYFEVAEEIDGLFSLHKKFNKNSNINWSEVWRSIYDSESKSRLITLGIALVSMTVVLAAKSANLETLFEVFSEKAYRGMMGMLLLMTTMMFFLYIGLRILTLTVVDALAPWFMKLFGGSTSWLLGYLIRDLVTFHNETSQELDEIAMKKMRFSVRRIFSWRSKVPPRTEMEAVKN